MTNRTYHKRGKAVDGYWPVSTHPNYGIWAGVLSRCTNPNETGYENYGGRGVSCCDRWGHFENFCEDMGVRPGPEYTIDRIDNSGNYCPENCRWATRTEQCLNRRMFSNNTTGATGVVKKKGRYEARYDEHGVRYKIGGTFTTIEEAQAARVALIARVQSGEDVSDFLERPARYDSSTGVRGISRHQDGGYMVRVTVAGVRKYLGYFKTFEEASQELVKWKKTN